MEYQYLDTDQQKAILEGRLRQLEQEHYGHMLNKTNASDDIIKEDSDLAMAAIDAAYEVVKAELASLTEVFVPTEAPIPEIPEVPEPQELPAPAKKRGKK